MLRASCALAISCAAMLPAAHATGVFSDIKAPATAALTEKPDNAQMRVILALPLRDEAGLKDFIAHVSNPSDPMYGHYLTPAEFAARFGTDQALHDSVRAWAISAGLKPNAPVSSRAIVSVSGTAHQFAELFGTKFATFHTPTHGEGQVMLNAPHLPDALVGKVTGVVGLSYAQHYAPLFHTKSNKVAQAEPGNGYQGSGYAPNDIRYGYQIQGQTSTAKTETIGIFEQGGYVASDLTTYESQYKLKAVPVTQISVNNAGTTPELGVLPEDMLDLDVLVGLNNALAGIRLYTDSMDTFQVALLDSLNDMATDDLCSVISISYGGIEADQGSSAIEAENTAFMQLASQGQTVFASAGDDDSEVLDPSSQPYVTAVGGTTLNLKPGAQETWVSETVWNSTPPGSGSGALGTGGGISGFWAIPSYQVINGVSVAAKNGGSSTFRNTPDVAAVADPSTGYSVYCPGLKCEGIGWGAVGGTSLASPIWAAMTSIINADRVAKKLPRVGYYNPTIYPLGNTAKGFHDITVGNNIGGNPGDTGFTAGKGYDNTTGWGSIDLAVYLTLPPIKP